MPDDVLRRRRVYEIAGIAAVLIAVLAAVTWPYARVLASGMPDSTDPMFSVWRLSWFAHAVQTRVSIANANIFYPETGTFAFSDTMFFLDGVAAPFLWAGVNTVLVYNLLLAAGFIGSGVAFFLAARALGVRGMAAVVGAAIFTVAPYRIEHLMHLELQWLVGAIAAIASTVLLAVRPSTRTTLALAGSLILQFLTSIYYAIFILPLLAIVWLGCVPLMASRRRAVGLTVVAGVAAGAVVAPVALLHMRQEARLGDRSIGEVTQFSAMPADYLTTPDQNLIYGRPTNDGDAAERRLFPGVIAITLACIGLLSRRRRVVVMAIVLTIIAFDLSLGTNGIVYPYLYRWLPAWRGLRAAARYGAYVLLGISTLAALGWEVLLVRLPFDKAQGTPSASRGVKPDTTGSLRSIALTALVIAVLCVEYASPQHLLRVGGTPPVYALLKMLPAGVILEYPTPANDTASEIDADYVFWSTTHWRTLVNGYSAYYPLSFLERAARLQRFPSDDTLAELRALQVRYVIVHPWAIEQPRRADVLERLSLRHDVTYLGSFADWRESAELFEIAR